MSGTLYIQCVPGQTTVFAYRPSQAKGATNCSCGKLELALLNLALNARDAMPRGGRLAVIARCMRAQDGPQGLNPGDYVCVSVLDSGTGMDASTAKRATEPFFTTKGVGKGTGLGLPMVHGLAAQSGGAMRIFSSLGEGTTVGLWLPVSARAVTDVRQPPPVSLHARSHGRVLVVDDDPLICAATADLLEDLGYRVVEAASGQHALDLLRRGTQVDLIITDHAMPGITGTELAHRISAYWPDLPVILATGYADLPNGEDAGLPRLSKPFRQAGLAVQIARVFGAEPPAASVEPVGHDGRSCFIA